ncbi:MAG: hypothetical protein ABIK09_00390 [Pseudomonadota bacterium]
MGKAKRSKDEGAGVVALEARVDLTEDKIHRYLIDDRLREAAGVVAEEIQLVRRVKDGTSISGAWVEVDGPVYTTVQVRRYTMEALCTCHATGPCPHGGAVALLYLGDPHSFLDLDRWLEGLETRPKDELLGMLRTVLSAIPTALEMMDIPNFESILTAEHPSEEEWWGDEEWEDGQAEAGDLDGIYLDDDDDPPDPENLN